MARDASKVDFQYVRLALLYPQQVFLCPEGKNIFFGGRVFMKMVYNVEDRPKPLQVVVYAIQQLLAIMAATLVVPVITGNGMQPAAALFGAGVGTIVYLCFTRFKSPVFLGSSFAFLGSMAAAFAGAVSVQAGYAGLIIGATFAGLVYVVIALIVKFAGVQWINKLMPPVVIGPTVAIIGLSLAGNAIGDITKGNIAAPVTEQLTQINEQIVQLNGAIQANGYTAIQEITPSPLGSPFIALLCGLVTLAVTMICSCYGKKGVRLIPFIIGILAGYATALVFTLIGNSTGTDALKILNLAPLQTLFADGVTLKSFLTLPEFTFLTAAEGVRQIDGQYLVTLAVAYIPVAFVVFAEHIADHKNISSIIERDLLDKPGLHRTLLGDGVGSIAGAFFGGCPNTTYGESVACVAITRNASVITIFFAAVGAMLISFISPFVAFVNSIPSCVMGGVCMALYGFIAVSGLKMIKDIDLNQNKNLFVVSVILIAGIGGLKLTFGQVEITNIAMALILGILTNLLLARSKDDEQADA